MASGARMNPANTLVMMMAAATTTRAPAVNPPTTASVGPAPCTCASRIPATVNTW